MSQSNVFNLLKKENKFMSAKEISVKLNVGLGSVTKNLSKMYKYKEVIKGKGTTKQKIGKDKYFYKEIDTWKIK